MNISGSSCINNTVWQVKSENIRSIKQASTSLSNIPTINSEFTAAGKYDTLELSEDYKAESTSGVKSIPEEENISEAERIRNMFILSKKYGDKTAEGYRAGVNCPVDNEDDIAEVCGAIGREIDKAYADGKISEDEMNSLNSELGDYSEYMTKLIVNQKAMDCSTKIINAILNGRMKKYFEDMYRETIGGRRICTLNQRGIGQILKFCVNEFDIDKDTLLEKIQKIREEKEPKEDYIKKWKLNETVDDHLRPSSWMTLEVELSHIRETYDGFKAGKSFEMMDDEREARSKADKEVVNNTPLSLG